MSERSIASFYGAPVKVEKEEASEEAEKQLQVEETLRKFDKTEWHKSAFYDDQMENQTMRGTWKLGPRIGVWLDISKPDELKQLNALLARTEPESAPGIVIVDDGSAQRILPHVFLIYREAFYRHPLEPETTQ